MFQSHYIPIKYDVFNVMSRMQKYSNNSKFDKHVELDESEYTNTQMNAIQNPTYYGTVEMELDAAVGAS